MQPTRAQIEHAAAAAAAAYGAEQVILFGSQARGEAGPGSDVDLLVLTAGDGSPADAGRASIKRLNGESAISRALDGTPVHVLLMSKPDAEEARCRPAKVGGIAVEEGVTVYADPAREPLKTGARYWVLPGNVMVKKTLFEPKEAARFTRKAKLHLKHARMDRTEPPEDQCVEVQKAMEHALKGFLTAKGLRVAHTHDINELWDAVEEAGVRIEAPRNRPALDQLSQYAGELEYAAPPPDKPASRTLADTSGSMEALVAQAHAQVPGIAAETAAKLKITEQAAIATTEPVP